MLPGVRVGGLGVEHSTLLPLAQRVILSGKPIRSSSTDVMKEH